MEISTSLHDFCKQSEHIVKTAPMERAEMLKAALTRSNMTQTDLLPYVPELGDEPNSRRVLYHKDEIEVVLYRWEPGSETKIHDHGSSEGAVKVLVGEGENSTFRFDCQERLIPELPTQHPAGSTFSLPYGVIHKMSNLSSTTMISLHVYSPPVTAMRVYELPTQSEREMKYDEAA